MYETDVMVSQYCEFHYGDEYFNVDNFPKRIVQLALDNSNKRGRALDIGCSVGRATFELNQKFKSVDGLDFSSKFIQIANQMKQNGYLKYINVQEGDLTSNKNVNLEDLDLSKNIKNINFYQADAMNMDKKFNNYDLVIAVNLIDRLSSPLEFLKNIGSRINQDGLLLIASPYTWLEEYTPKKNWIGGYMQDEIEINTKDGLIKALKDEFILIQEPLKIEFVIRETKHKFQHTISEVTMWRKK